MTEPSLHLSAIDMRPEELLTLRRARLAEWEVPWEIEFRRELPKSFVGKVLRRVLVEEENKVDS
ncbi:MAG TPA: hypothetical protein VII92_05805 [Anaerolineae bacterium]